MIDKLKAEMETAQIRIREFSDRVSTESEDLLRSARHQVHLAREEGSERLYKFEKRALEWADDVIERVDELPVGGRVKDSMERLVVQARDAVTALPIEDYDTLNARAAAAEVRKLDSVGLAKVLDYETSNKARKTVFEAIERRRTELAKPPFVEEAA